MKSKLILLLSLILSLIFAIPQTATSEDYTRISGSYYYSILDDSTIEITYFDSLGSKQKNLVIPDKIDGLPVSSIGYGAFTMCLSATTITIPNGITRIAEFAFSSCWNVETIILPDSIEEIGEYAFYECPALKEINIPINLKTINEGVFADCRSLESITIPNGVESIGSMAFSDCNKLQSITVPSSVTLIGDYIFYLSLNKTPTVTVSVEKGSYAEKYCKENNLSYIYTNTLIQ